jgi:ADP-ribosylglycohydrolase
MPVPTQDQFTGCLIGCAIGDAVGAVIEGRTRANAVKFVEEIIGSRSWGKLVDQTSARGGYWSFGQYTDDTQLSRELVLSIVENGGFDAESFAGRIANIFNTGQIVGGGRATADAARALTSGAHWTEAGTPPPRAGNGAPMRAAPIGLLHWNDSEAVMRDAWDQSRITHQAEMSCGSSVAIAMATAMSLNASRETSHPGEYGWWKWLAHFVAKAGSKDFCTDIETLADMHFKDEAKASEILAWILKEDKASSGANDHWDGISPWARTSTLWALFAFMRSPKDFWKTLSTALLAGGDTDTIAAMACAMSGAYNGITGIDDEELTDLLHDKGKGKASDLKEIAVQLHQLATAEHPEDEVNPVMPDDQNVRKI